MKDNNRTQYVILGMLTLGAASGYEITKRIQGSTQYFWSESQGQIYPTLARCEAEGLVSCKEKEATKTTRAKKIYTITAQGKKALSAWLKKEPSTTLSRNELLLKLFFGRNMDEQDNIHHVVHRQKELESELETYQDIYEKLRANDKSADLKYWLITLDYGIKTCKAELSWCRETLQTLKK